MMFCFSWLGTALKLQLELWISAIPARPVDSEKNYKNKTDKMMIPAIAFSQLSGRVRSKLPTAAVM